MDRNIVLEKIREVLISELKHQDFNMTDDLTAAEVVGWDSLTHMLIITGIEEKFNIKFRLKELSKLKNMGTLISLIESKLP